MAALLVGLVALGGPITSPAQADQVLDFACDPNGAPEGCSGAAMHWTIRTGPGRCDTTLKFLGGPTTAVMFQFDHYEIGYSTPWSGWVRAGATYSTSDWSSANIFWDVWRAQDRHAYVRARVTGPCHIANT